MKCSYVFANNFKFNQLKKYPSQDKLSIGYVCSRFPSFGKIQLTPSIFIKLPQSKEVETHLSVTSGHFVWWFCFTRWILTIETIKQQRNLLKTRRKHSATIYISFIYLQSKKWHFIHNKWQLQTQSCIYGSWLIRHWPLLHHWCKKK